MADLSQEFLAALSKVTGKRSRAVIDHILQHGHVTTGELKDIYGYNHAARAPRDVREEGIPLETFFLKGADGRRMAAYKFADLSKIERHKLGGRQVFSKSLKKNLYSKQNGLCAICSQTYESLYLQVDHRVPYEVAGDDVAYQSNEPAFMLVCASCQRSKSWTCEHCENWKATKDPRACSTCYWGSPEKYTHLAMQAIRRVVLTWSGGETKIHARLLKQAAHMKTPLPEYIKKLAEGALKPRD